MPFPLLWNRLVPFWRRSEILAAGYLRSLGYKIIASGFRITAGEIDIIARDGEVLVFVEVKSRRSADPPEDAVNLRKRRRIVRAAQAYIRRHRLQESNHRFDIVTVNETAGRKTEFSLFRDAFREADEF